MWVSPEEAQSRARGDGLGEGMGALSRRPTFQGEVTVSAKAPGCEEAPCVEETHGGQCGWSTVSEVRQAGAGPQCLEGQDEFGNHFRLKSWRLT